MKNVLMQQWEYCIYSLDNCKLSSFEECKLSSFQKLNLGQERRIWLYTQAKSHTPNVFIINKEWEQNLK